MVRLSKINITQFKNYDISTFTFTERVIGIYGLNGKGKTNLLDAVYYLCFTKSYSSKSDLLNIQFEKDGFRLEGTLASAHVSYRQMEEITGPGRNEEHNSQNDKEIRIIHQKKPDQVLCIFRGGGKKEFLLNGVPYGKYSDHIGKYPCVMIAPDDIELITGGSENRRRFIDTLLSQVNAEYLQQLIIYSKVLLQRNSLLKRFAELGKTDWALLEVLDQQLVQPGKYIHSIRKSITLQMIPLVQQFYKKIANNEELVTLHYESQLNNADFETVLDQYREKDFLLQRTNAGIHKDDIGTKLNGHVFKNIASQGQRKSLLFALKLAEFEIIKLNKGYAPLLLLDDVFEKLDDNRIQNLLHWVCNENNGQVFITDTNKERLEQTSIALNTPFQLIGLK
ncbi:MAG: DNA replication and repair protein RecF [Ferruginibacter sp.]